MSEAAAGPGIMEVALKGTSVIDMHPNLQLPPKHMHSTHTCEESCPDDQTISASCVELSTVTHSSYKNCSSPTNLSTTILRCERCDSFETSSRATLLLHVVQCLSSPVKLKPDDIDVENLSLSVVNTVDQVEKISSNSTKLQKEHFSNCNNNGSGTNGSSRKVFECDVCNMKFSNGANMRRHKMRHTGVKPYECRVCQKRFFRKDHLAEHFTTHTKTLPYHCPICNRGFQRQIAMRAHFQNEHVGQHDLVKTCPLCSYRAGSMKSLRIHFYNRHGIDLDNPGQGGSSSLLLALESQASQAASVTTNFVSNLSTAAVGTNSVGVSTTRASRNGPNHQSDSAESLRSNENSTPPMHYLTPHVEISMQENSGELFNVTNDCDTVHLLQVENAFLCVLRAFAFQGNSLTACPGSDTSESKVKERDTTPPHPVLNAKNSCTSPGIAMEQQMDFNNKLAPNTAMQMTASPKSNHYDNEIMPSISLIPIKQELNDDLPSEKDKTVQSENSDELHNANREINDFSSSDSCKLSSLIKVSPLKSLLREDLKRRICAKANNRVIRNSTIQENNNIIQSSSTPTIASCNSTAICNGTITSTGQETEATILSPKQILACHFCGIEFPDETLYFLHKGCHCESNPWKCNICGEQCNNVYEFNSHLLSKSHQ